MAASVWESHHSHMEWDQQNREDTVNTSGPRCQRMLLTVSAEWAIALILFLLYNILCTVNTQHTSRQDAIVTIRLYLATCFGHKQPSSGQLRTILRYSKISTQWDPISFTFKLDKIWKFLFMIKAVEELNFHCTLILFLIGLKMAVYGRNM